MNLYGQDPELGLLSAVLPKLPCSSVIDAGAERGSVTAALLDAGARHVHAIDPHPDNVAALRARFGDDARVTVHDCALSDTDRELELHVSCTPDGHPVSYGHTILERQDTSEIAWTDAIRVVSKSISSLIADGELPSRVGILKVDTEGHDLAVVRGMGPLECALVMVEHWVDLPEGLGACPWKAPEMVDTLRASGFSHYAFVVHRGEFVTLKWDDATVETGEMGNLIFVHDSLVETLWPEFLRYSSVLAECAVSIGQMYMGAARERQGVIAELKEAADARLVALEATSAEIERNREEMALEPGPSPGGARHRVR